MPTIGSASQVWVSCTGRVWSGNDKSKTDCVVMRTDAHAACVSDPAFQAFAVRRSAAATPRPPPCSLMKNFINSCNDHKHAMLSYHKSRLPKTVFEDFSFARSLERGIIGSAIGMLGKVWSSGALAVVQNVAIIPGSVHPQDKLEGTPASRSHSLQRSTRVFIDIDVPHLRKYLVVIDSAVKLLYRWLDRAHGRASVHSNLRPAAAWLGCAGVPGGCHLSCRHRGTCCQRHQGSSRSSQLPAGEYHCQLYYCLCCFTLYPAVRNMAFIFINQSRL